MTNIEQAFVGLKTAVDKLRAAILADAFLSALYNVEQARECTQSGANLPDAIDHLERALENLDDIESRYAAEDISIPVLKAECIRDTRKLISGVLENIDNG